MSPDALTSDPDRFARIERALAEYLRAVDAGTAPDPAAWLAEHADPDLQPELGELLAAEAGLRRLADPLRPASAPAMAKEGSTLGAGAQPTQQLGTSAGPPIADASSPRRAIDPCMTADLIAADALTEDGDPKASFASLPGGTRVRYFGDYEIRRELGRGGMGVVYQARQLSLNRPVALKVIKAGVLAGDVELRRFQNEAEAVALLDHPGIVPVYEVGEYDGRRYLSMRLVSGNSLVARLDEYRDNPRAAARLVADAAMAVHHAHMRGILHRDLKPANILIDEQGHPNVTDFGLAKRVEADSELTQSGAVLGTPSYMAPEQASGRRGSVTTASDVYGLGAILYALLTGRAPFGGESAIETLDAVRTRPPEPPRKLNSQLPRDLEVICLKCLEKEPGRRYATAAALGEDLRRYLACEPIAARPVTPLERAAKWVRRRPAIAGLLGLVALVTTLGLGGVLWQWREAVLARGVAEHESIRAAAQTKLAEQRLYVAGMNLVQRYWEEYNGALLQQRLDEQLPANQGGIDRRGFEWYYWQRKMSSGHITLRGDANAVSSVAFSPDAKWLASAGQTVKLWDAATGQQIRTLKGHTDEVFSVAFSPDGKWLASADRDGAVTLWDVATGQETLTLKAHSHGVRSVAFSPDGKRLASASSADNTVKLWDTATGQETRRLNGHNVGVDSVAFSSDGKWLACAGAVVKVWDAATGQETRTLEHRNWVESVAFSPDGKRLATASWPGTVTLWDTATGQQIRTLKGHTDEVFSVAFSPDGKWLASAGWDETVRIWDAATGQQIRTLKGHTYLVKSVAFSPDGKRLASASWNGEVMIWVTGTEQETRTPKGRSVTFSPDGHWLASASNDHTVRMWDAVKGQETRTLEGHTKPVNSAAFSPDGKWLASASQDKTVKVWDTATGEETRTLKGHTDVVVSVAFSPDGKWLASASPDRTVKVWDTATGRETRTLRGHKDRVDSVVFSPDGNRIASASGQAVKLWDAATGRETVTLKGHRGEVNTVAFSPDGKWLASAGWDATVRVWDAATGQQIRTLSGHTRDVFGLSVSPDGRRLASAGADGTVKLWDVATGQETLTLKAHSHGVRSVAFSPDGRRLAAAGLFEGTAMLWDARPLNPVPVTPGRIPR